MYLKVYLTTNHKMYIIALIHKINDNSKSNVCRLLQCMRAYVEFEVVEGAYEISCPDALCEKQGVITLGEIERLVSEENFEKHKRFRLNRGLLFIKVVTFLSPFIIILL